MKPVGGRPSSALIDHCRQEERIVNTSHAALEFVHRLSYVQAKRYTLLADDAEDCAMMFVQWYWLEGQHKEPKTSLEARNAWLRRCANNRAKNYVRHNSCAARHEVIWTDINHGQYSSL